MAGGKTQAKGKANKAAGSVKKAVGKATKNRSLQAKGTVQNPRARCRKPPGKSPARSRAAGSRCPGPEEGHHGAA